MANPGSSVVNGARAKVLIGGELGKPVAAFSSISFSVVNNIASVYILGNPGPVEINYVGMEPVSGNATGWKVIDGTLQSLHMPTQEDILKQQNVTLKIYDRQTSKFMGTIVDAKFHTFSTGFTARQQSEYSISFTGMYYIDIENNTNGNIDLSSSGASKLNP